MGADISKALKELDFEGSVQLSESHARALWDKYDVDRNGKLDLTEIRHLCADWCTANGIRKQDIDPKALQELVRVVDKVVNQFLHFFDVDHDGFVTKEEFFGKLSHNQAYAAQAGAAQAAAVVAAVATPSEHARENSEPEEPKSPEAKTEVKGAPAAAEEGHRRKTTVSLDTPKFKTGTLKMPFKKVENNSASLIKDIRANPLNYLELTRSDPAMLKHHLDQQAEEKAAREQAEKLHALAEEDDEQARQKLEQLKAVWADQGAKGVPVEPVLAKKKEAIHPNDMTEEEVIEAWEAHVAAQPDLKEHVQSGLRNLQTQVKRNLLVLKFTQAEESPKGKEEPPAPKPKSLDQREREVAAREEWLGILRAELESREAKLQKYAEQLAERETLIAEREAKQGVVSEAPGITVAVFAEKEREEDKLRRELIVRRATIQRADETFEAALAQKEAHQKKLERERGYGKAENLLAFV